MKFIEEQETEELLDHILLGHKNRVKKNNPNVILFPLTLEKRKKFVFYLKQCIDLIILNDLVDPFLPELVMKIVSEEFLSPTEEHIKNGAILSGHLVLSKLADFYVGKSTKLEIQQIMDPTPFDSDWTRENILNYFLTYWKIN